MGETFWVICPLANNNKTPVKLLFPTGTFKRPESNNETQPNTYFHSETTIPKQQLDRFIRMYGNALALNKQLKTSPHHRIGRRNHVSNDTYRTIEA